jgi:hypothetical protein
MRRRWWWWWWWCGEKIAIEIGEDGEAEGYCFGSEKGRRTEVEAGLSF